MKLKRLLIAFVILCTTLIISGCWDYQEFDDLTQILGLGVDFDPETQETTITVQFIPVIPAKGSTSDGVETKGIVYAATDDTFFGALSKLQQTVHKKLFFPYLNVVVIGEEAAKHALVDLLELFDRTPAIRSSVDIVFTAGTAEATIATYDATMIEVSSAEIRDLVAAAELMGAAYPVSIFEFQRMMAINGIEPVAPRVISVSSEPEVKVKGGAQSNIRHIIEREGDHRVAGLAVFNKGVLVGWLDDRESRGYGWITGKNPIAYKDAERSSVKMIGDTLYYRVWKSKGSISVNVENKQPSFQINVQAQADLRKYYSDQPLEYIGPKAIAEVEKKLAESIQADIEAALEKAQKELKSDIFGFGFALFRENPRLWRSDFEEDWDEIYPDIEIVINVETTVINSGVNLRRVEIR